MFNCHTENSCLLSVSVGKLSISAVGYIKLQDSGFNHQMGCAATSNDEWNMHISPQEALDRVQTAMGALGWRLQTSKELTVVEAAVGATLWSWGEVVTVSITGGNASSRLFVSSMCRLCTQGFDWGKNAENVRKLHRAMGGPL